MAKNLKLHVKNTQLAEAINLRGLKAKLSRKKETSPEEAEKLVHEAGMPVEIEEAPHPVEMSQAPQGESEAPLAAEFVLPAAVEEIPVPRAERPPVHEPAEIVQTGPAVQPEPPSDMGPPIPQEPVEPSRGRAPAAHLAPRPHAGGPEPTGGVTLEQKLAEVLQRPRGREVKGREPGPSVPSSAAQGSEEGGAAPSSPPPFLAAARGNPDQLGPVLGREIPPPRAPIRRREPGSMEPPARRPVDSRAGRPPSSSYEPFRERRPFPPHQRPPFQGAGGYEGRPAGGPDHQYRRPYGGPPSYPDRDRPPYRPPQARGPGGPSPAAAPVGDRSLKKGDGFDTAVRRPKVKESRGKGVEQKGPFKRPDDKTGDARARRGLSSSREDEEEGAGWRKRRPAKGSKVLREQAEISRPTKIRVRLPISVKELAAEMKLKAAQLISTLFLQGTIVTLNDVLTDEILVQLLGQELGCEVEIDTSEEERVRITGRTIAEEISSEKAEDLVLRPPVVTFMGHVDHGKTSLIDAIRHTNRASGEVGAITQHIGAFTCMTDHGPIAIIDTPGHEAFSAMRERGAEITDIVVLVVAGDEGIQEQTVEALNQAKESHATVIVAINKCDKPNFDADRVFRQLADLNLLPEVWGGTTITVSCSATTREGVKELLEMIALQSEVLELRANASSRARGTVIESEMCKGLGPVATVLVQNGTLRPGDCLVFGSSWARVKSMRDDRGVEIQSAGPSTPVRVNGLSALPAAGEEFIAVKNEKEARDIAETRREGLRQMAFQTKRRVSLEKMMEGASGAVAKKVLNLILRADVQGSLEALKTALLKIVSDKVELNIVSLGVGEISESDIQLAATSKAVIIGFHTGVEAHAESMVKEFGVVVRLHSIIYHAQDDVRALMKGLLDKTAEEVERGRAEVKALFRSSQLGIIAGCLVLDGTMTRSSSVRVRRGGEVVWSGPIDSLKRFKEDVREVSKGIECGVVLRGFSGCQEGDQLEAFEIVYHEQEL